MCLGLSDCEQLRFLGQWFSKFLVSRSLYPLKIEDLQKLLFKWVHIQIFTILKVKIEKAFECLLIHFNKRIYYLLI